MIIFSQYYYLSLSATTYQKKLKYVYANVCTKSLGGIRKTLAYWTLQVIAKQI